jgi:hypothetical protein
MDIHSLKKEITIGLDAINEQTYNILAFPRHIPQIEIDIAMGNMRKLYENFYALGKLNQKETEPKIAQKKSYTAPIPEPPTMIDAQKAIVEIEEPKAKEIPPVNAKPEVAPKAPEKKEEPKAQSLAPKIEPEPKPQKVSPPPPIVVAERPKTEKTIETIKEVATKKPEVPKKPVSPPPVVNKKPEDKKPKQSITTADLYENQSTLADKFMSTKDNSLGAQMQNNKISDLKKSIGINERFLFVSDLFGGSMEDYNNAIENLNSMGTRQQAHSVINNLSNKYDWDGRPDAFNHFLQYIERRFADE